MIDHTRKLIFIHIARTAGTSIETALVGKDWWLIDPYTKHISARSARSIYGEYIWNSYIKFSVVRNPWDRIISMWATKWWHQSCNIDESCSLEEFLLKIKPHPHEKYNTLIYDEIINEELDFILRFESLRYDFLSMMRSIGVNDIFLPHVEKREHRHYTMIYSETEKNLVARLFEADILRFGYSFSESVPTACSLDPMASCTL